MSVGLFDSIRNCKCIFFILINNVLVVVFMFQIAAENVKILNAVKCKLPFLVTTSDDAKNDSFKEEIGLR